MTLVRPAAFLLFLVAASLGAPTPVRAADPLTDGRRALAKGKWDKAETRLRKALGGPTRAEARLILADLLLLRGRPAEAEPLAIAAASHPGTRGPGAVLIASIRLRQGRPADAVKALKQVVKTDPEAYAARTLMASALLQLGQRKAARRLLEPMLKADDREAFRSSEDLTALGRAARLLGRTRFAFQALDEAANADPTSPEPLIELGRAAFDVYDTIKAEQAFQQALAARPGDPRALVGLARIELEIARTHDKALEMLDKAQAVDPGFPDALRLRAVIDIFGERPEAALETLKGLLAANSRDLDALDLVAAAYHTLGDRKAFERTVRKVLKIDKRHAAVFIVTAQFAERQNRYKEAIALARRSLKTDPDYWRAHAILGVQLTRTGVKGDEAVGRRHLERYFERDDYDVRVTNLLNLYERWLVDYVWIDDPDVRIRVHKSEAEIAERVILPFAKEMLARYDKRYPYQPPRPVVLELFHEPNLFALRSVGLPGVASHGLCFGRLVTARSPSSGDFNWGMVVAHEFAHIYGLGLSKSRVPRWFTEGMAEYETNTLRPEWTRYHGQELHHALQADRIPGVLSLSRAFTQAHDLGEVVVAYQQSSLVVHHLVETAGYAKVVAAHARFAKGERLASVIKSLTGLEPAEFDRRFKGWLRGRTKGFAKNWDLDQALYRDAKAFRTALGKNPNDVEARAGLAAHFWGDGNAASALLQANKALARAPRHPVASFVAGMALLARKRHDEALPLFDAMVQDGHDGYAVRRALIDIALTKQDAKLAEEHMVAAIRLNPQKALPHSSLAHLLERQGRKDEAEAHYERWAMLSGNNPVPSEHLAVLAVERRDGEAALRWSEHLGFIAPYSPRTHVLRAGAYILNNAAEDAWLWYAAALAADPDSLDALVGQAETAVRLGRNEEARRLAEQCLKLKPGLLAATRILRNLPPP